MEISKKSYLLFNKTDTSLEKWELTWMCVIKILDLIIFAALTTFRIIFSFKSIAILGIGQES